MRSFLDRFGLPFFVVIYFAIWLTCPHVNMHPKLSIPISTISFMAVQIAIVYYLSKQKFGLAQSIIIFLICVVLSWLTTILIIDKLHIVSILGRYPNLSETMMVLGNYIGPIKMIISLLVILMAGLIGNMVSLRVKDKNLLLPVVMFAAYIDCWTVFKGPVSQMLKKAPYLIEAVGAPIPQLGAKILVPISFIGPGDFLFMAVVFSAVHRLSMRGAKNYWFVFASMTLGMLGVVLDLLEFLPALMVLAIGVIAANWKEFKLSKQEKISTLVVAILLAVSLPLVWALIRKG